MKLVLLHLRLLAKLYLPTYFIQIQLLIANIFQTSEGDFVCTQSCREGKSERMASLS